MSTVEAIATSSGGKASKRQPLSLAEKVRARLELFGGSARSSQLLPYVRASAAEVKALPGIVVTHERNGVGRPAVVFSLGGNSLDDDPCPEPETVKARAVKVPEVVSMDVYRPAPTPAPEPQPVKQRPGPVDAANPFLALL